MVDLGFFAGCRDARQRPSDALAGAIYVKVQRHACSLISVFAVEGSQADTQLFGCFFLTTVALV